MRNDRFRSLVAALVAALALGFAGNADARTFIIPHFTESLNPTPNMNSFDTVLKFVYAGGRGGVIATGPGADVNVYLFNDGNGATVKGLNGAAICNPCTFALTSGNPAVRTTIEQLANNNAGGLRGVGARRLTGGYAVIVVTGDADLVALEAYTMNTHASPFDVSFEDLPIRELSTP